MYFIDLFKRILRKSNISLIIYLILNVLIISGCSALVFYSSNVPVPVGLLIGRRPLCAVPCGCAFAVRRVAAASADRLQKNLPNRLPQLHHAAVS